MSGANIYSRFHDWRVRLYDQLDQIEGNYLTALRDDLQQTIERLNAEIARRAAAHPDPSNGGKQ